MKRFLLLFSVLCLSSLIFHCYHNSLWSSAGVIDTSPPVFNGSYPLDGGTMGPDDIIVLSFNEAMDGATCNNTNIVLEDVNTSEIIPLNLSLNNNGPYYVQGQPPASPDPLALKTGHSYVLSISSDVADSSGNKLATGETINFTVATVSGNPKITFITPNISDVLEPDAEFLIQFSHEMDDTQGIITIDQTVGTITETISPNWEWKRDLNNKWRLMEIKAGDPSQYEYGATVMITLSNIYAADGITPLGNGPYPNPFTFTIIEEE